MAKDTNELPGVLLDPVKPPTVGAHDESVKRGHELDPINAKPFIQFTAVMIVLFVAVWILCAYVFDMTAEKWYPDLNKNLRAKNENVRVSPLATELNNRSVDERIARIDTLAPTGKTDEEKVYAPRLEAFKSFDFGGMPEYVRSANVVSDKARNPPEYHPEDLLPSRDPILGNGQWDKSKKGVARLPIDTVVTHAKSLGLSETLFKHQKGAKTEYDATTFNPSSVLTPLAKASNGGRDADKPAVDSKGHDAHDVGHPPSKDKK